MPPIAPPGKPRLSSAALKTLLAPFVIDRALHPLVVVGIRGYYRDSLGAPGVNDRGIYDDAFLVHSPSVMAAYNGNVDPSAWRKGSGTGSTKGMASLNPGAWFVHQFDLHRGKYLALCQRAGPVTVTRDGTPPYVDSGYFGINIHRGGYGTTGSEGCQTVLPEQWESFIGLTTDQAKRYHGAKWRQAVIPYVLMEHQG